MQKVYPQLLKKGGTIGVTSLTWTADEELTYAGEQLLNTLGFEVDIHENASLSDGQMAGTEAQRLQGLYELVEDPVINAIMFVRGGYGTLQLLETLDFKRIAVQGKPLIGYSDFTAILNALYTKTGLVSFHGPLMAIPNPQLMEVKTQEAFLNVVVDGVRHVDLQGQEITTGSAEGTLVGGNMTVFDQLIGTPYFPPDEDLILLLEDAKNEEINELDKKFLHFKHAGILPRIKGVILGEMNALRDNDLPFGYTAKQIIHKYLPNIPALEGVACGHEKTIMTLPIGATVTLNVGQQNTLSW